MLGVPWGASEVEVRRAFRRLALEYHPDRNRGDVRAEARFKMVSAAFQRLKVAGFRLPRPARRQSAPPAPPWASSSRSSRDHADFDPPPRPEFWPDGSRIHYPSEEEIQELLRGINRRRTWPLFRRVADLWLYVVVYPYAALAIMTIPLAILFFLALVVLAIGEQLGFK